MFIWTSAPAQPLFTAPAMANAATYSANTGGTAVLILQNGELIYEAYHNGADASTATHLHSATKGFWSLLAAHALETGLFDSYEERVAETITEWQDTDLHPYKRLITIRHLLTLSSGLSQDVNNIQGTDPLADDIYQYVVDSLNLNSAPGNVFQYGPSHYYAFGVLLERKLQQAGIEHDPLAYLDSILLHPIGLEYDSWVHDDAGNPHLPNGCYITPRNWMKFGQLLLQKGRWESTQLVDSNLVADLFTAPGPNPGHGHFVWLNHVDGYGAFPFMAAPAGSPGGFIYHHGYNDIIGLLGAGKNRMYIIPSLNAVVLRQTLQENDNFDDHTFLAYLLDFSTATAPGPEEQASILFPNPARDELHLRLAAADHFQLLEVINASGQTMLTQKIAAPGSLQSINISSLPNGPYWLRLVAEHELAVYRFLKAAP
jgi:CubicO group peptidase (beta-lactamase class C family)